MSEKKIAIAGAGFSGATLARQLAEAGCQVEVFDPRPHIGGNCHTARDEETGVMLHVYGPHIFHTESDRVWEFVRRFGRFRPYIHLVMATVKGQVYSLPFNLHTINQFYGRHWSPAEAEAFIRQRAAAGAGPEEPKNMEEQAIRSIGEDLYRAFVEGYTAKHWGIHPRELPASIIKRLPVRFNYNTNYFSHKHQGMPENGYTEIVGRMLDHPCIRTHLGRAFPAGADHGYDHLFWTGPLDAFFGHSLGRLGYRTLDFEVFRQDGDFQGNTLMNYPDAEVPFTRITEHKHFMPWEAHAKTVCYRESSRACGADDIPYYPIRLVEEKSMLGAYVKLASAVKKVSFVGRLGTYRYLDMDVTIKEALEAADLFLAAPETMPAFAVQPL